MNAAISDSATATSIGSPSCSSSAHSDSAADSECAVTTAVVGSGSCPSMFRCVRRSTRLRAGPSGSPGVESSSTNPPTTRRSGDRSDRADRRRSTWRSWSENRSGVPASRGAFAGSRSWHVAQIAVGDVRHPPDQHPVRPRRGPSNAPGGSRGPTSWRGVSCGHHTQRGRSSSLDAPDLVSTPQPTRPIDPRRAGRRRRSPPRPRARSLTTIDRVHPQPSSSRRSSSMPAACATSWITVTYTSSSN